MEPKIINKYAVMSASTDSDMIGYISTVHEGFKRLADIHGTLEVDTQDYNREREAKMLNYIAVGFPSAADTREFLVDMMVNWNNLRQMDAISDVDLCNRLNSIALDIINTLIMAANNGCIK